MDSNLLLLLHSIYPSIPTLSLSLKNNYTILDSNNSRRRRRRRGRINDYDPIPIPMGICACNHNQNHGVRLKHQQLKEKKKTTTTTMKRVIRVSDPLLNDFALSLVLSDPVLRLRGPSNNSLFALMQQQQQQQQQQQGGVGCGGENKQEYHVNMGYAIRTLREEFPHIFSKQPTFDIYRDDIVFRDPLNTFSGINSYKRIFWALRFVGHLLFKSLWIDTVSVWQPVENVVMIRWIVHGIPRVPWETRGRFDGISEYKLDGKGKIFEHRVDNIAPNPPTKFQMLAVDELIQSLGCPSTANPTYFETSLLSVASSMPFLLGVTVASYYLAFYLVVALRCTAEG